MNRDKQIEEMTKTMCAFYDTERCYDCRYCCDCHIEKEANRLYNAGYRKASDVAEEIIGIAKSGAEKYINDVTLHEGIRNMMSVMLDDFVAKLKEKYTEDKKDNGKV